MKYISVKEASIKWGISDRSVRDYCSKGRILGAKCERGVWFIPEDSDKPKRKNESKDKNYLLEALKEEKANQIQGGIYHKLQIDLAYNSNHIEGSKLTHDETRYIYETSSIGLTRSNKRINVDDIIETVNHFYCLDKVIDEVNHELSENLIKELHKTLKSGTSQARLLGFSAGVYKKKPNIVGDIETTSPEKVSKDMSELLEIYNPKEKHTLKDIIDFHVKFETIHPFQDGNGRVGRLIAFKECLKNNIVPFIITDDMKFFYYRGLKEWNYQKGYLTDTCLHGQDIVKSYLDYFKIKYNK